MIEDVVVTESWTAVDADNWGYVGFEVSKDAVPGSKRLAGGGPIEWREALVGTFKRGCCHFD